MVTQSSPVPGFLTLELGNVIAKKIRRGELTRENGRTILKELRHLPLQRHADDRLFPAAYELALNTQQSLYDCLYLALAEVVEGRMVTADRKFYAGRWTMLPRIAARVFAQALTEIVRRLNVAARRRLS